MDRRKFILITGVAFIAGCGSVLEEKSRMQNPLPPSALEKLNNVLNWQASPTGGVTYKVYKNNVIEAVNITGTNYTPVQPQASDVFKVTAFKNGLESEPTDQLIWGT